MEYQKSLENHEICESIDNFLMDFLYITGAQALKVTIYARLQKGGDLANSHGVRDMRMFPNNALALVGIF